MILEMPRMEKKAAMEAVLQTAWERAEECDEMIAVMQKKEGGYIFFCSPSTSPELACFLAQQFVHHIHRQIED
jgi:hypothetical protein